MQECLYLKYNNGGYHWQSVSKIEGILKWRGLKSQGPLYF